MAQSQIFQVPRRRKKLCVLRVCRHQPKQDLGSSSSSLLPNGTMPTACCPSAKLLSAGLLGLIQDLQQLLYPFRCCSFNCPYKPGLPDLSLLQTHLCLQRNLCSNPISAASGSFYYSASVKTGLVLESDVDFCTRGNVWTGRNLHPATGVVKPATAVTSAAPESFVPPQHQ